MSQTFHGTWEAKEDIFFAAPCISQAPFHAPFRGGYQGEGRLSKMDCSDTTQSLQVVLGKRFKMLWWGLECRSLTKRTDFYHVLTKHEQLERLKFCLCPKRPRKKKERFGCGIQFCWFALQNFVTRWGGVDQKLRIRLLSISHCPWTQCEGGDMQNSTRKEWFNISLTLLRTTSNKQAKYSP